MKAKIEIECDDPDIIIKSIEPDIDVREKFNIKLEPDDDKIKMTVESDEITGLLAGINSYMRLIRAAMSTGGNLDE